VFTTWDTVTMPDLAETFGIDVEESWDRPWWWLRSHILALLDTKSRLAASVQALIKT
jgi:hypothetical protein